jgi:dolichol kinase
MEEREGSDQNLNALLEKTEGLQPWRRVFHASNGLIVVGVLLFTPLTARAVSWILAAALTVMVLLDALRLLRPEVNRVFFRAFLFLASPREKGRLASSTWYVLGVLLTLLLFPVEISVAAILVLALADPAASVLGRLYGKRRFGKGTLVGSSAFLAVAFPCLLTVMAWPAALAAAAAIATVEIIPWPLDDNLVLPIASGVIISLLA